jgi:hypothetical protein
LNGVTTVINHGPKINTDNALINVWHKGHALHSVRLEKKWRFKLNIPFFDGGPFIIHIGEGTDQVSKEEIDRLLKWNLFNRKLVGIHAVAMNEEQAAKFKALIWCPDSNFFLLGNTAEINKLKQKTKIIFGTDSTVSSDWNLWNHLRLAKEQKMVSDSELIGMLTSVPPDIWNMPDKGTLLPNYSADIVIGKMKRGVKGMDAFFSLNPENILMILNKGKILLIDDEVYGQLPDREVAWKNFHKISINKKTKYVFGNLPGLINSIKKYYPDATFPVNC